MKKICFIVTLLLCFSLCSCRVLVDTNTPKSTELSEKYSFYENSVASIRGGCNVSPEEADEIFLVLVDDCGIDKEVTVTPYANAPYSVKYGSKTLSMTLDGSNVSEVLDGENQIYPATVSDASAPEENIHHNILLDYELTVDDVLSDSGDLLGQYAYIRITSKQLDEVTAEDIKEFADTVVYQSGYNWVSIITSSDTGICFTGSDIAMAMYGKLDEDGSILDASGYWVRDKDGNYSFVDEFYPDATDSPNSEEHSAPEETEAPADSAPEVPHRSGEEIVGVSDKDISDFNKKIVVMSVPNDVTENWKYITLSESTDFLEYALSYYDSYFGNDKEIHAVVNFSNKTTTKISVFGDKLEITVHDYVDGEEHDAKIMFSGTPLANYIIYTDNGDIKKAD